MDTSGRSSDDYESEKELEELALDSDIESCLSSGARFSSQQSRNGFIDKLKHATQRCKAQDFETAVKLYTDALNVDPNNHVVYSNRSAAHCKLEQYNRALQDAIRARELNPKWPKAYYRQGIALQALMRHADAMAAFASGLAQDNKDLQLLAGLVEVAMKSPFRATLEPIYRQLRAMQLDKSPFVITSVIGQELLSTGHYPAAIVVLESSLRIGTCSLKLRGSVYSALSSAYWALNDMDKAIQYMQSDLQVAKSLGDQLGECRSQGNLGSAFFSRGNYKEALAAHRHQLVLAMKGKFTELAASALTCLGHVYNAIGDLPNALASHKQCLQLVRQLCDQESEAREIGNVAAVSLSLGDYDRAIELHEEHLQIAKELNCRMEEAKAYSNLGAAYLSKKNYEQAIEYHEQLLRLAQEIGDKSIECRAYAGLGHSARGLGDVHQARRWYERQLDTSLVAKDKMNEGRACSNLGIVYQILGDFDGALKLHWSHLQIAKELGDAAGMGRSYGNIGSCYSSLHRYDEALKYKVYLLANNGKKPPRSICSN
ncbi:Tetratricopeptide repeat protein 28 [Halotydeus destructor]|nr:Tetratricopeptide repeat protein 28 [Halotydeus destructor]